MTRRPGTESSKGLDRLFFPPPLPPPPPPSSPLTSLCALSRLLFLVPPLLLFSFLLSSFFSARASSFRRDLLIRSFALTFTSVFQRESSVIASLAVPLVLLGPEKASGDRVEWLFSFILLRLLYCLCVLFPPSPLLWPSLATSLLAPRFTFVIAVHRIAVHSHEKRHYCENFVSRLTSRWSCTAVMRSAAVRSSQRRW